MSFIKGGLITKEEIAKLKKLQQELLTQKPDGTRDPRLFVIMEPEYTIIPKGFEGNGHTIFDHDGNEIISDSDSEEYFQYSINTIIEKYALSKSEIAKLKKSTTTYQVWDVIWDCEDGLELFPLNVRMHPSPRAVFFTRKAAEEHLKANGHHHPADSYTYSTYPDRCEDWQLVGKLLRELDFDKLEAE